MKNILEEFYHGNVTPNEPAFPSDPQYKLSSAEIVHLEEQLMSNFSAQEKELYELFQSVKFHIKEINAFIFSMWMCVI